MAEPVKRVHYFDHQFLREGDFTAEQSYHMKMRRLHNSLLHTWGIAEGLALSFASGASRADINEGVAVDGEGQEMVLVGNTQTEDLSGFAGKTAYVTIEYRQEQTDSTSETGVQGYRRWEEKPFIDAVETAPTDPSKKLILGRVTVGSDGKISSTDEGEGLNRRRAAGVVGGDLQVRSLTLTDPTVVSTQWPRMRLGAPSRADLAGSLRVTGGADVVGSLHVTGGTILDGNVGIGQATPTQKLDVAGTVKATAFQGNGAQLTNVVLKAGDTMTGKLDITATGLGLNITNNAAVGGTLSVTGNLTVTGNVGIGQATPTQKLDVAGTVKATAFQGNNLDLRNAVAPDRSALIWTANVNANAGVVALVSKDFNTVPLNRKAAVAGGSLVDNVHGVYASAPAGTFALYVDGTSHFQGAKDGYVVDIFVNASGQRLRTGDVVKLKGTPVTRFQGDCGKIPVIEVTLADQENDTMVIGVVDGEAIPQPDVPDTRVGSDDPTFTEDGGALFVVTLGTYAHCKVDATEVPIQVGDLLTSSTNPGHAKKATNPTVGSTIGKALEPLQEGTGYIAIFVNNH